MNRPRPPAFGHLVARIALLSVLLLAAGASFASETQRVLHTLDYIGADYPDAVSGGRIADEGEYAELTEFSTSLEAAIATLPATPARRALEQQARELRTLIADKAPAEDVAALTRTMGQRVIAAYQVRISPRHVPDLRVGAALFAAQCASCHGATGQGDGPLAAQLTPAPSDFHDAERQMARSVYGLFNTISLGVEGTGMDSYATRLSDAELWSLAFYAGNFLFDDDQRERGAELWQNGESPIRDLNALTQLTPTEAQRRHGDDGLALLAYLRSEPGQVMTPDDPLMTAREQLDESLAAYLRGDTAGAYQAAVSAYLDGFELGESRLRTVAPKLVSTIEQAMLGYRSRIKQAHSEEAVTAAHGSVQALLEEAQAELEGSQLTPAMGFVSALSILLREGLEAILILAAVAGVLIKSGRRDALPYLHLGWGLALLLGVATWAVSEFVLEISGASRELTEGLTALLAAVVLLYVGLWLHGKTHAQQWNRFVRDKIQNALQGRALLAITGIAFLAVYREVFETVLFYQALTVQADPAVQGMVWTGAAVAAALLLVLAWLIIRYSMRLPLRLFFTINAAILFVLAIAFAGHGVAALQEAGVVPTDSIPGPHLAPLGIYPTLQTLLAQFAVVVLITGVMLRMRSNGRLGRIAERGSH